MCGRFIAPNSHALAEGFGWSERTLPLFQRNPDARPTQRVPVVLADPSASPTLVAARWGFVPTWWTGETLPSKTFNARIEGAATQPMWRDAWRHHHCLFPIEGWYEWRDDGGPRKRRYRVTPQASGSLLALAGLYSPRAERDDATVSATIITRPSAPPIDELHPRMPWVLRPEDWSAWLDPGSTEITGNTLNAVSAGPCPAIESGPMQSRLF